MAWYGSQQCMYVNLPPRGGDLREERGEAKKEGGEEERGEEERVRRIDRGEGEKDGDDGGEMKERR